MGMSNSWTVIEKGAPQTVKAVGLRRLFRKKGFVGKPAAL
jgi:hypothetical protein